MHESGALEEPDTIPVTNRTVGQLVPLTATQLGCFRGAAKMGFSIRMCAAAVRLLGPLNVASLSNCLQTIVQRHESLRTRIVILDGEPMQTIDLSPRLNFDLLDLTDRSLVDTESESKHIAQAFIDQRIDLLTGPLFEVKLIRISHADHALILLMDHIISDAVSCDILNREIWTLYWQAERQIPLALPELPIQFADYAFWQQQMRDSWRIRDAAHWDARLNGAPAVRIPLDNSLSETSGPAGARLHIPFGKRLTSQLHEVASRLLKRSRISWTHGCR